jgi:hypothetical protein
MPFFVSQSCLFSVTVSQSIRKMLSGLLDLGPKRACPAGVVFVVAPHDLLYRPFGLSDYGVY